jgi:hypothetical protein
LVASLLVEGRLQRPLVVSLKRLVDEDWASASCREVFDLDLGLEELDQQQQRHEEEEELVCLLRFGADSQRLVSCGASATVKMKKNNKELRKDVP